jgi:LmbE family N-acetylglucosaminyl deacetylase
MKRWSVLGILLAAGPLWADPVSQTLTLSPDDRILVLSPHPDDDLLGCAGVIQRAVEMKLPVRVVYLTNGDNYELAFWAYQKRPVLTSRGMLKMGRLRRMEAIQGEGRLGLSSEHLIFLGYPDWGTEAIFTDTWSKDHPPLRSMLTKVSAVPYAEAYRPGAPYRAESVLADLKAIMTDFKPTKVFVSHPADGHRDHRAFYLFAQVALWDLDKQVPAELFPYLVHYRAWPQPRGFHPDRDVRPPAAWAAFKTVSHTLEPSNITLKRLALREHHTQMALDRRYLESFVGPQELFIPFPEISLSLTGSSHTLSEMAPPSEEEEENEIAWRHLYVEQGALVLRMEIKPKARFERPIVAYAFGYRRDRSFAEMPKLKLVVRKDRLSVFDQNKPFKDDGIQVGRQGKTVLLRVPLKTLGDPEKIIGTASSRSGQAPFDWRAWRVIDLGKS